jgi:serine/threonine protein kinase/tetratricopeptide (TPR) repeat protein
MLGQTISHYKILEKLGEGGMGVVYKAHDTKLDREVALKFLPQHLTTDVNEKARFIHEAKAASALNHPNITTIYEIDEHNGQMFIAMEYCEGKTLRQLMDSTNLTVKRVLEIAVQVCEGLALAHERRIVHRDIKPDNIMVATRNQVKVMDFGLAKLKGASKLTKTGSTVGTTSYMSPEQAQGEDVDHRSDIFSFGVVLYEMLAKQLPFKGEHQAAIMYAIVYEEPQPIARFNNEVSPKLEEMVLKALTKEKGERYQHIDDLLADLRREKKNLDYSRAAQPSVPEKLGPTPASVPDRPTEVIEKKREIGLWKYVVIASVALSVIVLVAVFNPLGIHFGSQKVAEEHTKSIAVLPFKNMSDSKQDEFFSDGITEDIITQLSKINELHVISRSSAMQYKGTEKTIKEIGQELDVATILEGSVRRAGNQVRITAELIDASSSEDLWADTYDKQLTQIFTIQSDVARQIASALQAKLSPTEEVSLEKKPTQNLDAYTLYLQGRFYWRKRSADDLQSAAKYFQSAIQRDPQFALAYVGLADCYALYPYYYVPNTDADEAFARAERMARKALGLDSTLAEAHTSLGNVLKEWKWDWRGAEKEFKRAIELNPKYATAHQWYSEDLMVEGRLSEALEEARTAAALEPASLIIQNNLGLQLLNTQNYQEAIPVLERAIELDPSHHSPHENLEHVYLMLGRINDFLHEWQLAGGQPVLIEIVRKGLLEPQRLDEAVAELDRVASDNHQIEAQVYGITYAILDKKEKALAWLERSAERKEPNLPYAIRIPFVMKYRDDPTFQKIEKEMGIQR